MAETAVNIVVERLGPLLLQEAKLLKGVRKEVGSIKVELESIQSFLRDADGKAEINVGVKTWVKQVQEVAYHIEDVIDEFILNLAQCAHHRGFAAVLQKSICRIKQLKKRHEIAIEIQKIKTSISEIKERSERYGFNSLERGSSSSTTVKSSTSSAVAWHYRRLAYVSMEEAKAVGMKGPKQQLLDLLLKEELERRVFSLVGMAGLGKTALARLVFDSQEVKSAFPCTAWITVSQSHNLEDILRTMMKQFHQGKEGLRLLEEINTMEELLRTMIKMQFHQSESGKEGLPPLEEINTMEELQLIDRAREYLLKHRYLVVFDDVVEIDFWESIEFALPDNEKGSRIIVTSRITDVASSCVQSSSHIFKLQPLPPHQAWELFCKKVFDSSPCPQDLEELGLGIVKKCHGLPLAIAAIGRHLSTREKGAASHWQKFHDSLPSELESNAHLSRITRTLSLSYSDLPYHLKTCFFYCAIFPQDYPICCMRLIHLWIAEGFVQATVGKTLEDVAEDYLNELIQRSLIQTLSVDFEGHPRTCQVHGLIREILVSKYEESKFCHVLPEKKDHDQFASNGSLVRRLSIHTHEEKNTSQGSDFSKARSIFLFDQVNPSPKKFNSLFTNYTLVKVLDFEDSCLENVAGEVGNLYLLKYLSVRGTRVSTLPKSIGKLLNLETLDLTQSDVTKLPLEILGLCKLRNLLAYNMNHDLGSLRGVKMPGETIGSLEALEKLFYVEADRLVRDLKKLKQLRKLGLIKVRGEKGMDLCAAVEKMKYLMSLDVASSNEEEILKMQSISSPPEFLQRLYLSGRLEKFPGWISKLRSLVRIRLRWSRLSQNDDLLNVLQGLPNLLELRLLCQAYDGDQLHFKASGFQKLKVLDMNKLENLSMVTIEEGGLPLLEELSVGQCTKLNKAPVGIQQLTSLSVVHIAHMSYEFYFSTMLRGIGRFQISYYFKVIEDAHLIGE